MLKPGFSGVESFPSRSICAMKSMWGKPQFTHRSLSAPSHQGLPQNDRGKPLAGTYVKDIETSGPLCMHIVGMLAFRRHRGLLPYSSRKHSPCPPQICDIYDSEIHMGKICPNVHRSSMRKVRSSVLPGTALLLGSSVCTLYGGSASWPPAQRS